MLVRLERRRGKVAILHGAVAADAGPDEQDALVQADWVARTLAGLGFAPVAIPLSLDLEAARARLVALKPAFAVNLVESLDGQGRLIHLAPSLLDSLGLSYTGSATEAIFLTSHKPLAKGMMAAAGIATLLADPERRTQIAQAARAHAVRNFDWRAIGEKQRALLRELMGE